MPARSALGTPREDGGAAIEDEEILCLPRRLPIASSRASRVGAEGRRRAAAA